MNFHQLRDCNGDVCAVMKSDRHIPCSHAIYEIITEVEFETLRAFSSREMPLENDDILCTFYDH